MSGLDRHLVSVAWCQLHVTCSHEHNVEQCTDDARLPLMCQGACYKGCAGCIMCTATLVPNSQLRCHHRYVLIADTPDEDILCALYNAVEFIGAAHAVGGAGTLLEGVLVAMSVAHNYCQTSNSYASYGIGVMTGRA